jgi:hypothetical protein
MPPRDEDAPAAEPGTTLEDDIEIASVLEQVAETEEDAPQVTTLRDNNPLRKKLRESRVRYKQGSPFLAAVEMDLDRKDPINLKDFYLAWVTNGERNWLNPYKGIAHLREILHKFIGKETVLKPFVALLTRLAEAKISPASFSEYVMLPRMKDDNNWRKWEENHLEALGIIANLIIAAKQKPPFNRENIEAGHFSLSRDIVLVRYIGRPIAEYKTAQLRDSELLGDYVKAWEKISLKNSLSIYFMRRNVLHFVYAMSGRLDLLQLVALIEQLPAIEKAFAAAFPEGGKHSDKAEGVNLFEYDIGGEIHKRKKSGYLAYDFTAEVNAYLEVIKNLLEKNTGVYLCTYYATLFRRYKDPVLARTIARLVKALDDRGGMHIYKWHTKKLVSYRKTDHTAYVEMIEACRGCDPEYPRAERIFRDADIVRVGEKKIPLGELFQAYLAEHPEKAPLAEKFRKDMVEGKDRAWDEAFLRELDAFGEDMHLPLLHYAMPGVGTGFSYFGFGKSKNFQGMWRQYGGALEHKVPTGAIKFEIPIKEVGQTTAEKENAARDQVNLVPVEKVWNTLNDEDAIGVENARQYINTWSLELNGPIENAFTEKAALEQTLNENESAEEKLGEAEIKKLNKEIGKKGKALEMLRKKKQQFELILTEFDNLSADEKFILIIVLAGSEGGKDEAFAAYALRLILLRYAEDERIASRLEFLKDDVSIDVLTYAQLTWLLNLLETMFVLLRDDETVKAAAEASELLPKLLSPYIITRKKEISADSIDAAAKKAAGYAPMQAERAKWQGLLEDAASGEKKDKNIHRMGLYLSKTPADIYYGDMGGICLSAHPEQILRPGFFNLRLVDLSEGKIVGMAVLFLSAMWFHTQVTSGWGERGQDSRHFWQAFAFNPLNSFLRNFSEQKQLFLYLQFRLALEKIAWNTKLPVLISGIGSSHLIVSNQGDFAGLIKKYELAKPTAIKTNSAKGVSVVYSEEAFADALVIIDPRGCDDISDISKVPSFFAHRELANFRFDADNNDDNKNEKVP